MNETRDRILDVALDVLGENPDAGMGDIASAAGVVRRTVYGHFPSRLDLVRTLTERAVTEMTAVLTEVSACDAEADAAWAGFIARLWPVAHRYRVLLALRRGEYGEAIHGLLGPVDELLADLVKRGQRRVRTAPAGGHSEPGCLRRRVRHRGQRPVERHPRRPGSDDHEPADAGSSRDPRNRSRGRPALTRSTRAEPRIVLLRTRHRPRTPSLLTELAALSSQFTGQIPAEQLRGLAAPRRLHQPVHHDGGRRGPRRHPDGRVHAAVC
jgi:AcrR family transcriptional regulator